MKLSQVIQSGHLVAFTFNIESASVLEGVSIKTEEKEQLSENEPNRVQPVLESVTHNGAEFDQDDLGVQLEAGDVLEFSLRNNTAEMVTLEIELDLIPVEPVTVLAPMTIEEVLNEVLTHPARTEILERLFLSIGIKMPSTPVVEETRPSAASAMGPNVESSVKSGDTNRPTAASAMGPVSSASGGGEKSESEGKTSKSSKR